MMSIFPITNPALIFALAMFIFLTAPLFLKLYRLPGIVGIILIGALIGPNALYILDRDETIILLGEIGLLYLMFLAGLEINVNKFIEKIDRSVVFGLLSFIIPQTVGTLVGIYVLNFSIGASLLFAAIFASHTLLAYPVIKKLGIIKNEGLTAAVGGTIITDTLALLVLTAVISSTESNVGFIFWLQIILGLSLFFIGAWTIIPIISKWFFGNLTDESYFEFLYVMTVMFICAFVAEITGVEAIIGAFLAGLVLNRLIPNTGPLMNRIEFVGNALFIPFFLLSVGMLVDIQIFLNEIDELMTAFWLIGLLLITKLLASWIFGTIYKYDKNHVMSIFGLSIGQAAAALAIVLIGFEAGIFDQNMINSVVLMIFVIGILSPTLVDKFGRYVSLSESSPLDPGESDQRILVPFSCTSSCRFLLFDLAMIIKDRRSDEPIHTISVVKIQKDSEKDIIKTERVIESAKRYVSTAELKLRPQIRLNYNIASGIIRSVKENRINTVILGWDGTCSVRGSIIGSVIDQVLDNTDKLVLVSHLKHPLSTIATIQLILLRESLSNPGIYQTLRTIKRMSEETGYSITIHTFEDIQDAYDKVFKLINLDVPFSFEISSGRKELLEKLRERQNNIDDMVVYVTSRINTPGWDSSLKDLPNDIAFFFKGNLIIIYPSTEEDMDDYGYFELK
ncbi:cation:proton antiporter [Methanosalsum natronophilum]|nr:cation:proton antiporter [Methanosalsum natronophilum]MCS3924812.1 Kef-type K+ transport system membrane component KefB [Methanosalsum natronophilum]